MGHGVEKPRLVHRIVAIVLVVFVLVISGLVFTLVLSTIGTNKTTEPGTTFDSAPILGSYFGKYLNESGSIDTPTGIASYGIYNYSGLLRSYVVNTTEVSGGANISALAAESTSPSGQSLHGSAGLQLNLNMLVRTQSNETQIYWLQNVVLFSNTSSHRAYAPLDEVFNETTPRANIDGASGMGSDYQVPPGNLVYYYGNNSTHNYRLPLSITLLVLIETIPGKGVNISFYNEPFGGGNFDQVILSIPDVESAMVVVSPNLLYRDHADLMVPFDAELVWTGYCCAGSANFTSMNSTLSLSYLVGQDDKLVPFPSLYSFGTDTAEKATDLKVSQFGAGSGLVSLGKDNNSISGN